MTLPFDDIFSASGSVDRPVLLSEKTQLLAIKALQIAEFRASWDEMTDASWDDLDTAIGEAHTEILTIIETDNMLSEFGHAFKTNTQNITASTPTDILFNGGDHETSPQVNRIKPHIGHVTIAAFCFLTAATATQLTLAIKKNGADWIARQSFVNTGLAQRMQITVVDECIEDDYYTLEVLTNQNSVVQNAEYAYLKWVSWWIE